MKCGFPSLIVFLKAFNHSKGKRNHTKLSHFQIKKEEDPHWPTQEAAQAQPMKVTVFFAFTLCAAVLKLIYQGTNFIPHPILLEYFMTPLFGILS